MSDAKTHLDSVAREYEKSKDVAERFRHGLKALKDMRDDLEKSRTS